MPVRKEDELQGSQEAAASNKKAHPTAMTQKGGLYYSHPSHSRKGMKERMLGLLILELVERDLWKTGYLISYDQNHHTRGREGRELAELQT